MKKQPPFPVMIAYGYINKTTKRGDLWFADVCIVIGDEYQNKSLLMIGGAERIAIACMDIEKVPVHEWGSKQWFKLEIEFRPKYDGVLKSILRVQEYDYKKWQ